MPHIGLHSQHRLINAPLDSGTEPVAAVADAGNYVFAQRVTRCWVTNQSANDYKFRANTGADDGDATTEASETTYDGLLTAGDTIDISLEGARDIKDVSIFYPAAENPGANKIRVMGLPN